MKKFLTGMFPFLVWLPTYSWKKDFPADVVSGCTIAVMHIPQGMGYALLAGVAPIVGIYMAVFPVFVYFFLGTSRHISLGTLAVTTLMTGRIVDQYGSTPTNMTMDAVNGTMAGDGLTNLEVATLVCFMVGVWQVIMGVFHLGVVGMVLSEHLVGGFTTGAAFHVLISQIKNLLGIQVPRYGGAFRLVKSTYSIFAAIPTANPAEIMISSITIICLAVHNDWVKPWYSKKIKFPLPIELVILAVGTMASYYGNFSENYQVKTLDTIPTGIPTPTLPPFHFIPNILIDTLIVAIVVYALTLSMAKIFAGKCQYTVDNNQELLALGAANLVGSFFSCVPVSASLSRSLLQFATGGVTQIASLISCALLIIVLLWIGPVFESLPLSLLSAVIIVTLKGMFMQFKDLRNLLKLSPLDAAVWIISLLATVLIDIDIGLGLGVVASISVLIYRGHCPHYGVLGRLPETEFFADASQYPSAVQEPGLTIFRWVGAVHFANKEAFQNALELHLPAKSTKKEAVKSQKKNDNKIQQNSPIKFGAWEDANWKGQSSLSDTQVYVPTEHLILDFSALSYIDLVGTNMLTALHKDLKARHIELSLAIYSDHPIHQLERYNFFDEFPKTRVYPSVMDAVVSIKSGSGMHNLPDLHQELP